MVHLSTHLSFIITSVIQICRRDQSNFPNNSIIIGTSEGYYCSPETGGVPSPYHSNYYNELINYLPHNSLIEVKKSEVR